MYTPHHNLNQLYCIEMCIWESFQLWRRHDTKNVLRKILHKKCALVVCVGCGILLLNRFALSFSYTFVCVGRCQLRFFFICYTTLTLSLLPPSVFAAFRCCYVRMMVCVLFSPFISHPLHARRPCQVTFWHIETVNKTVLHMWRLSSLKKSFF